MTVPGVARNAGEGGLLGPGRRRATRDWVYAYLTSTRGDNRIVRFKLGGRVRTVLTGLRAAGIHNGGRIAFGPDGKLYAGVGDAGNTALAQDRSLAQRQDPAHEPGRERGARLVARTPQRAGARVGPARAAVGERVRPEHARRGQPDPARAQLRLAGGRGRRVHAGGRFTNPKVTWATSAASPSGAAIIGTNLYVAALQGECVWKIPLRRRFGGQADAHARGPLRAHPDRRRGAGRDAVGGDVQPRRPRLPARQATTGSWRCGYERRADVRRGPAVDADDRGEPGGGPRYCRGTDSACSVGRWSVSAPAGRRRSRRRRRRSG